MAQIYKSITGSVKMNIDLEHIRSYFKKDRFATGIGIEIDSVTKECVTCSLVLNDSHKNSIDNVQNQFQRRYLWQSDPS